VLFPGVNCLKASATAKQKRQQQEQQNAL